MRVMEGIEGSVRCGVREKGDGDVADDEEESVRGWAVREGDER